MKRISPQEAKALIDDGWLYLDVRTEPEFEQVHAAGSYNVPLLHAGEQGMVPNPRFREEVLAAVPRDAKVIIGCQSGGRSARAAELLADGVFAEIADQRAGGGGARDAFGRVTEPGWVALNLPVGSGRPAGRCYADLAKAGGGNG